MFFVGLPCYLPEHRSYFQGFISVNQAPPNLHQYALLFSGHTLCIFESKIYLNFLERPSQDKPHFLDKAECTSYRGAFEAQKVSRFQLPLCVCACSFLCRTLGGTTGCHVFLQERIMKMPYGEEKEYFTFSLFLVLCNRALTCSVCVCLLWVSKNLQHIYILTPSLLLGVNEQGQSHQAAKPKHTIAELNAVDYNSPGIFCQCDLDASETADES